MLIMMVTVIMLSIIRIILFILINIIMIIPIIIIIIIIISTTIISYSDVLGPLWAPRLFNQGSMLFGPRPSMFLLARLQVGRFAFVACLAALVRLWDLRWQAGLGSELIGRAKALPGASIAWLVDAGAVLFFGGA